MFKEEGGGYLSIEASFLLPFITLIIWFLIVTGFFLYNASYVRQSAYVAAVRGASMKRAGRVEIETETEIQIKKLLEDKLIMIDEWNYNITVNLSHVNVIIEAKIKQPVFSIISKKLGIYNIRAKGSAVRYDPVKIIRDSRKMEKEE